MKKRILGMFFCLSLLCFIGCSVQLPTEQEDANVQYYFSGKVQEVQEEYLVLNVYYAGNTGLAEGATVEVSTDVVAAAGCPKLKAGENARVVMAWNVGEQQAERLSALAIYKQDEDGHVYSVEESPATDTMPPFTIINGRYIWLSGKFTPIITPLQETLDKAEYIGEIVNRVSPNQLPSEELESNCFAEGRKLYHYQDETMETYIVVNEEETECYFAKQWWVYEKTEGSMKKVEEHVAELFPTPTPTPTALPVTPAPQYVLNKSSEELTTEDGKMLRAYISVLEGLLYDEELPERDVEVEYVYTTYNDLFAICDIDADGADELYISHIATYNAGAFSAVYGYNDGKLHRELLADTLLQFYDNGTMIQKAMHNHGMAAGEESDFWPYTLFRYDNATDSYVAVANVDAWDKSYAETDGNGTAFPDSADADGDGRVYFVMPGTQYEWNEPIDNDAYWNWYLSYTGANARYKLPTMELTKESIETLKKLIPDVPLEVPEEDDFLTLLKNNYKEEISLSASSPYILQADELNCMIVFGQGATTLVYVTRDGGTTWEQAEIPEAGKHQHAVVTCAAAISDTTYCVGYRYWGEYDGTNFYLTTDCGKTWARISPEVEIPEEITANMRYAEAVAVKYVGDKLQVQVSCKTTVLPPWSIEAKLESADLGKTWSVVEIWEKETDEE